MGEKIHRVDEYLENLDSDRREALTQLRAMILDTVPEVVETMRYNMPTFEYEGEMLCALASQKHYMSLYMDTEVVATHKQALNHLNCGKSCIRFKRLDQLSVDTIKTMLKETMAKREPQDKN